MAEDTLATTKSSRPPEPGLWQFTKRTLLGPPEARPQFWQFTRMCALDATREFFWPILKHRKPKPLRDF